VARSGPPDPLAGEAHSGENENDPEVIDGPAQWYRCQQVERDDRQGEQLAIEHIAVAGEFLARQRVAQPLAVGPNQQRGRHHPKNIGLSATVGIVIKCFLCV
jgi:hypothetical protein